MGSVAAQLLCVRSAGRHASPTRAIIPEGIVLTEQSVREEHQRGLISRGIVRRTVEISSIREMS
jgi:hypothetical protein